MFLHKLITTIFPNLRECDSQESHIPITEFIPPNMEDIKQPPDIGLVRGQTLAKEALLIAAAGGHNVLMVGPPGEGKSFLASTLPSFLPALTTSEFKALQPAYTAVGLPTPTTRPFRAVGPTASLGSLIGGGRSSDAIFPGDLALAHAGILFIDELPQFDRKLIDAMRQPLESGSVTITRSGIAITWPSRFQLIAAMNPCPCGYARESAAENLSSHVGNVGIGQCVCSTSSIERYQSHISGPILDRIDLIVWLHTLTPSERFSNATLHQSLLFKAKVHLALSRQRQRYINSGLSLQGREYTLNSQLGAKEILDTNINYLQFSQIALGTFLVETSNPRYSTRRAERLARVSRTVADLDDSDSIEPKHIAKAATFVSASLSVSAD